VDVDKLTGPDVGRGRTDPHAVLDDVVAGGDVAEGELVPERHLVEHPHRPEWRTVEGTSVGRSGVQVTHGDANAVVTPMGEEAEVCHDHFSYEV
jgi:hypothetical protein